MKQNSLISLLTGIILIFSVSCAHRKIVFSANRKIVYSEKSRLNDFDFYYIKYGQLLRKDSVIEIMCNNYIDRYGYTNVISKRVFLENKKVKYYCLIKDSAMLISFEKYLVKSAQEDFKKLSEQEIESFSKLFDYFPEFAKQYGINALEIKNYLGWYETKN